MRSSMRLVSMQMKILKWAIPFEHHLTAERKSGDRCVMLNPLCGTWFSHLVSSSDFSVEVTVLSQ